MTDQTALPWYRSRILQGLLTIVVSQIVARVQAQFHIDFMGMSVTDIVNWLMDAITAGAVYWATHARVAPQVPIPPVVTLTQNQADQINGAPNETPVPPATPAHPL
jgi:hypothetical protein